MSIIPSKEQYLKRTEKIRNAFEIYELNSKHPQHSLACDLYKSFDKLMFNFSSYDLDENEMDKWSEQLNLAGIKSHKIYTLLKKSGIEVEFDKYLLQNRLRDCPQGPDNLEFHLHHNVIEDLLNFLILGTANQSQLKKGDHNAST